jgi:hypothetical protein
MNSKPPVTAMAMIAALAPAAVTNRRRGLRKKGSWRLEEDRRHPQRSTDVTVDYSLPNPGQITSLRRADLGLQLRLNRIVSDPIGSSRSG